MFLIFGIWMFFHVLFKRLMIFSVSFFEITKVFKQDINEYIYNKVM